MKQQFEKGSVFASLAFIAAVGAGCTNEDKPKEAYNPRGDCTKADAKPLSVVHILGSNMEGDLQMVNDGTCVAVYEPGSAKHLGYIASSESFYAICSDEQSRLQVTIGDNLPGEVVLAKQFTDGGTGEQHSAATPIIRPC